MKILISWLAYNNDFKNGAVLEDGPTFNYHKFNYNYDKHILLSSAVSDDTRAEMLANELSRFFPERKGSIEIRYTDVKDVIDIDQIKTKVEKILVELREHDIDIFFSPGTSAMQLAWYICHTTLSLSTRLIQSRPSKFSVKKEPEFLEISTSLSTSPVTAIIKEDLLNHRQEDNGFIITPSIQGIYDKALKIAKTDKVTALIIGESGTGKENLSRFIHENSIRKNSPLVAVNCSAFNDHLLEARLFGYKKGSFTGADKDQKGIFEEANGGTIFLDEIGDISTYMQQSLLRVLQEQEILPLGSNKSIKVDIRIVTATNRNLPEMCKIGRFRWDLYYRLAVTELTLPNLDERGEAEKEALISYFLKSKRKLLKKAKEIKLNKEAKNALLCYSFPGNIRELENLIEQLYVFYDENVELDDLPSKIVNVGFENSLKWVDVEKAHILKVLEKVRGNQNKACNVIGYGSINTLVKKIRQYNINLNKYKDGQ